MARIAQIVSTARYLFEHAVTNAKLTEHFTVLGRPTVIDRLANSTGIMQRFYASDGWATSDLAVPAAKEALKRAGCKPEDVDLIIVGTTSPDYTTPDTSVVLQHKLGAKNSGIFDVDCACASFPALIAVASGLIATTAMRTILVVGVDMIHKSQTPATPAVFCGATEPARLSWRAATTQVSLAQLSRALSVVQRTSRERVHVCSLPCR